MVREEKEFCHFLELPPELRMMIIDKKDSEERTRFSGCSKLCNKEAKNSKNYIHGLEFRIGEDYIQMVVRLGSLSICNRLRTGFVYVFSKKENKQIVECKSLKKYKKNELWDYELDDSTDLAQFSIDFFRRILQFYQRKIKWLRIDLNHPRFPSVNFGVENFGNLENLSIYNNADIRQFLPSTGQKLHSLHVSGKQNLEILANYEQIYGTIYTLSMPGLQLNNEQFLQLKAFYVTIHIGSLTEKDIFNFIKSWQNGKVRMEKSVWCLYNSNFDVQKLFGLFGEEYDEHTCKKVDIKHNTINRRIAVLKYDEEYNSIVFKT